SLVVRQDVIEDLRLVSQWVHEHQTAARRAVVEEAASYQITPAAALELLTAQRWLERMTKHVARLAETLGQARALFRD
ncbi:MAG: hypothetical protein LBP52_06095, partial [Burkholderiaceae bacterium]|nr:hypothetical protein [Burkholderiaceae bacterium]